MAGDIGGAAGRCGGAAMTEQGKRREVFARNTRACGRHGAFGGNPSYSQGLRARILE
jgi:hypothetical protein